MNSPTTIMTHQDVATKMIKELEDEQRNGEELKSSLSNKKVEKDNKIKELRNEFKNKVKEFEEQKKKLEEKIEIEIKERDEITSKINSCDSEARKRKMIQKHYQQIKEIEAGTIDANDNVSKRMK